MEKYRMHVYFRHYIHDEDTLERYKRIVNRVNRATRLARNFHFDVFVNFDPGMPQSLKDEVSSISKMLIEQNVDFSMKVAHGAGVALFNIMEEVLSNFSVDKEDFLVCVVDGDSYPIDNQRFLRQVRKLADDVYRRGMLLGLAQRTKVILPGAREVYREINEIYFALAMRGRLKPKRSAEMDVPEAYLEFGDPVPGFYCLNMTHPKFMELFERIEREMRSADMTHFVGDHYLVLAASQMGDIATEIVPLEDNPPGSFSFENIGKIAREIGRTDMRQVLLAAVKSEENAKLLSRYYPPEAVAKVRDAILNGMLKK